MTDKFDCLPADLAALYRAQPRPPTAEQLTIQPEDEFRDWLLDQPEPSWTKTKGRRR